MNDRAKLPMWAQREIEARDRDIDALKRTIEDMVGSDGKGSAVTYDRGVGGEGKPLPEYAEVRFKLGDDYNQWVEVRLERDAGNKAYVNVSSASQLVLNPRSSNVVRVYTEAF